MPQFQPVTADDVTGPRLLVSVRDCVEAQAALDGGADIIDVKDPGTGPLGFAGFETICRISRLVDDRVPVSAAFGECCDWQGTATGQFRFPQKPLRHGPSLGKLGLAGVLAEPVPALADDFPVLLQLMQTSPPLWVSSWQSVRDQLAHALSSNECQPTSAANASANVARPKKKRSQSRWVAVAYADSKRASAPDVWSVLAAGVQAGCSILLIDTFVKDGQGTLTWLDVQELQKIRAVAHQLGLQLALAGQLTEDHLPAIAQIQPDILAVRGAVCVGPDRQSAVSADRVHWLHQRLNQTMQSTAEQRD